MSPDRSAPRTHRRVSTRLALSLSALATGCFFAPLDLEDKRCPCDDGLVCDVARDRCVREVGDAGAFDAGPLDSGLDGSSGIDFGTSDDGGAADDGGSSLEDAGELDGGPADSGAFDSGPPDSGPRDAGPGDAGRPDAGRDGGPADAGPWCPTHALVCEDFESGAVDNPPWDYSVDPQWSTTRVYRGSRSLRVSGAMQGDQSFLAFENRADPSDMHLRFWLYVPTSARIDSAVIVQLSTGTRDMVLQAVNNRFDFRDNRTTGMSYMGSTVPRDRWMCISMRLTSGATPRVVVGLDGTTMIDRTLASALAPTDAQFIGVGMVYMGMSQAGSYEAFLDDFVWSDQALPCP